MAEKLVLTREMRGESPNFQLNDAVFHNGQADGADFRLVTSCHQFYIHGITVFFDE